MDKADISERVSLATYCNYGSGGVAKYFAAPSQNKQLQAVLLWANDKNIPFEIIGGGCNLLISDEGYDGLIISTASLNRFISVNETTVSCGAGIKLMELTVYCIENGLGGFERLAGIPGCVGGGLKMNAGAFDAEMKDTVSYISVMDKAGRSFVVSPIDARFGYRKSLGLDGLIITGGEFLLEKGDTEILEKTKNDILARRKEKQPLDKPSCGSVFKRPEVGYAGKYIEECGLKGLRKGGAVISEKHANFILNDKDATSSDIFWLINKVIDTVFCEKGVKLQTEVKFIGF